MSAKLYYWKIKARNYHIMAVAQGAGIPVEQVFEFDMGALKAELPFGQVPYLVDGNVKIAQSNAIVRYLASKGNIDGKSVSEEGYALSEMLLEEATDIFNMISKANYASDKITAYNALFAPESGLHKQLEFLEKLHPGKGAFFREGNLRSSGGYTLAAVLDIAVNLEPTLLDKYPKIKAFYTAMLALPAFDGIRDYPNYYKRE